MQKKIIKTSLLASASVLVISVAPAIAVALPAVAHDGQQSAAETAQEHQQQAQANLTNARSKSCQAHETAANRILQNRARWGSLKMDVIGKIAQRVEDFYQKSGKTLTNYDTLLASVNDAKTAAQAAVDKVKSDKLDLKCDGTDPRGVGELFKEDVTKERQAIKDYKTAVKNLIVGVHSVQGSTSSDNNSGGSQ